MSKSAYLTCLAAIVLLTLWSVSLVGQPDSSLTVILGRPTDHTIALSVLATGNLEAFVEYGVEPRAYTEKTPPIKSQAGKPFEILLGHLKPNTHYAYRLRYRTPGDAQYALGSEESFETQRSPGSVFTFGVQGDSHPERRNSMYDPDLYLRTMRDVRAQPDFYLTLGDDFSVDPLYNRGQLNAQSVGELYVNQRRFLGLAGSSPSIFLVNGNHEQASAYLLDGTPNSPPVLSGRARNLFFPLPAPDAFYSGDAELVEFVGLRRDYYAFTWGDALFVTLDPYWHSPVQIDEGLGGQRGAKERGKGKGAQVGNRARDWWGITMGDAQYQWFRRTLSESKARFKFVFAHHVLGTGRGGVEMADLYEWGGRNRAGEWEFDRKRPGWELPVHQLMAKYSVTIFFQGHDHLFAHQQKDGVVYQETPNPADPTYTAFNQDAYRSGDVLPNSGHLRVTVSASQVKVDYIRSYLPKDEAADRKNGEVAFSYTIGGTRK